MEYEQFIERVIELMNERGWSKADLVRESGLPQSTVYGMLGGKSMPEFHTCMAILKAFDVRLFGIEKDLEESYIVLKEPIAKEQKEFLNLTRNRNPEFLKRVLSYTNFLIQNEKDI